jgi:3-methyladenine DNA glycosylase AlkD
MICLMTAEEIVAELRALADSRNVEGMARYGIASTNTLGISIPTLRAIAKRAGRDHALAAALWATGIHEARILAAMVDDPARVTKRQMNAWANDFDSWDVVDGVCDLFVKTPYAYEKAHAWSSHKKEYVKRAAFTMIAYLTYRDKTATDADILQFLPVIRREAGDERNFVKKAVNWALRNTGKRNQRCNAAAIKCAGQIRADGTKSGRWIAADALRELRGDAVQARLHKSPRAVKSL